MSTNKKGIRRIAFAGSRLDIEYRGSSAERVLEFLFRDLQEPDDSRESSSAAHYTYRLESDPGCKILRLYSGDELERECTCEADMALHLIGQACYQLAYFSSGGLVMHAALVSQNGRGVLLPGTSGKGKSTLAAWLLQCGFDYLTDELVHIPDGEVQIGCGFARPLSLKKAARHLLSDLFHISAHTRGMMNSASVDLIPHEIFGKGEVLTHVPVHLAIFPHFLPEAPFEVHRLSKAQAGLELMQCLINARNLPEHGFPQVIGIARTIPVYQMVYGDFSTVEVTIQTMLMNSSLMV